MGRVIASSAQSLIARLGARFPLILSYGLVLATFVVSYISVARTRPLFQPDARYYLAMSFWFSGDSQQAAHDRLAAYLAPIGMAVPDQNLLFGWGLVQPRVVLPALAAPFVRVFGPNGMLVVTGIAALILTLLLTKLLIDRFGTLPAVATMLLFNASVRIVWYNIAMLTESLSALWGVIALLLAWRYQKRSRWSLAVGLAAVTVVSAFTRQATFIVAAAFIMAWLLGTIIEKKNSTWGMPALIVSVTAIATQLIQSLVFPSFSQLDQFLKQAGVQTLGEAILAIPRMAYSLLKADIKMFMNEDHALLLIIVLAVVSIFIFWRREESHLLLGALAGIALYNVTNGVPTSFRYAMPGLVFFALAVSVIIQRVGSKQDSAPNAPETPRDA